MKEKKEKYITIRCTPSQKKKVLSEAENLGMKHSKYALEKLLSSSENVVGEIEEKRIREDVKYELRKIGNNINQIAKFYNSNTDKSPYLKAKDREILNMLNEKLIEIEFKL